MAIRTTLLLLVAAFLMGCQGAAPTAPTTTNLPPQAPIDSVTITAITPARNTSLSPGTSVSFDVTVVYTLGSADAGRLVLILQDQSTRPLQAPGQQPVTSVLRGTDTVSLSGTAVIPADGVGAVYAYVPVFADGAATSSTRDMVVYSVR